MGMATDIDAPNPFLGTSDNECVLYGLVYDYLTYPGKNGEIMPNLAHTWWYMNGTFAATNGTDFSQLAPNENPSDWPLDSFWGENPLFFQIEYTGSSDTDIEDNYLKYALAAIGLLIRVVAALIIFRMWRTKKLEEWDDEDEKI